MRKEILFYQFLLQYLRLFMGREYNVPSVSEVLPLGWIWAKVRSTEARYALLSDVARISYSSNTAFPDTVDKIKV